MADHFQLSAFELRDAGGGNVIVLISGQRKYYDILRHSFPSYRFSRLFDDVYERYDWGTYIYKIDDKDRDQVRDLLELLRNVVCLDDALTQTFALDYHMQSLLSGNGRTEIGDLVYYAKYRSDANKAAQLVEHMAAFINSHPSYRRADFIIAVPPSRQRKTLHLPGYLAEKLAAKVGIPDGTMYVRKIRQTAPMKDIQTIREKIENIRDTFQVTNPAALSGKLIILIDDIYQSGITLHELASELQEQRAEVQGLVGTKTVTNPQ